MFSHYYALYPDRNEYTASQTAAASPCWSTDAVVCNEVPLAPGTGTRKETSYHCTQIQTKQPVPLAGMQLALQKPGNILDNHRQETGNLDQAHYQLQLYHPHLHHPQPTNFRKVDNVLLFTPQYVRSASELQ